MQVEDPLSKQADYEIGIDLNNMNQVLLKSEFFAINALEYSDLAWGNLITLLVRVDKENSIEFPFNCSTLLIYLLYLLLFINSHAFPFSCFTYLQI